MCVLFLVFIIFLHSNNKIVVVVNKNIAEEANTVTYNDDNDFPPVGTIVMLWIYFMMHVLKMCARHSFPIVRSVNTFLRIHKQRYNKLLKIYVVENRYRNVIYYLFD